MKCTWEGRLELDERIQDGSLCFQGAHVDHQSKVGGKPDEFTSCREFLCDVFDFALDRSEWTQSSR